MAFRSATWWDAQVTLEYEAQRFPGPGDRPRRQDPGARAATSARTASSPPGRKVVVLDEAAANKLATGLTGRIARVRKVEEKEYTRRPRRRSRPRPCSRRPAASSGMTAKRAMSDGAAALRERAHHLHAYGQRGAVDPGREGGARPGEGELRPGVPAEDPAPVGRQVEERPGGARGDPARGGDVSRPRRDRGRGGRGRRGPPLRPDLEAHRRVPDARRAPQDPGRDLRLRAGRRRQGRAHRARAGRALRRLPARLRRGRGRAGARARRPRRRRRRCPPSPPGSTPGWPRPSPPRTRRSRRRATRKRASCSSSRSWASAGLRPTPASSAPSSTASTR